MDYNKEFDDLQSCMENFNMNVASELLSDADFIANNSGNIINLLGKGLTENYFKNNPDYFKFCEENLIKMAKIDTLQENIFDFLELVEMSDCKISSSVLAAVTVLENMENPERIYLEYLLIATFNNLNGMDEINLKDTFYNVLEMLLKLNKHTQHEPSTLYYFAKFAFLVIRANIDPIEFLNKSCIIIGDPLCLLEHEFEQNDEENIEKIYLASFFYLYFSSEIKWGPKVYNRSYVLKKCSDLALSVFENDTFGKSFVRLILNKYKDNEIPLYLLNKYHEEFFMEASQTSIFNDKLNIRKESFESLILYIHKLCSDAQYVVFKHSFTKLTDSGLKAELIIKMKQLLFSKIKSKQDLGCFQGIRLLKMVSLCCEIPDGEKCNIVENKEHVLAAITLLYVLYSYNGTELNLSKDFSNEAKQFAKTVQNAIDYTNDYYKLENAKLEHEDFKEEKIPMRIQNMNLPKLSVDEKRNMLSQYNTTVKLVQSNLDLFKGVIKD